MYIELHSTLSKGHQLTPHQADLHNIQNSPLPPQFPTNSLSTCCNAPFTFPFHYIRSGGVTIRCFGEMNYVQRTRDPLDILVIPRERCRPLLPELESNVSEITVRAFCGVLSFLGIS